MNCDEIRSRILYEAEDDPATRVLLDEHLAECRDCTEYVAEYHALLGICRDETGVVHAPAYGPPSRPAAGWRWIRAAAVVAFAILGFLFVPHGPVKTTQSVKPPVASWEFTVPASILSIPDQESLNFQIQVNSLHDQILEMRSRNAANQF
jgi:hypothetical protein